MLLVILLTSGEMFIPGGGIPLGGIPGIPPPGIPGFIFMAAI
jgi:hypothetical protein